MSGYLFAVTLCALLVVALIQLLRKRRIREKYAGIWIIVALGVTVLGAWPGLAVGLAKLVGVEVPANLVFSSALVVLLVVCVQLSIGVSSLDERVRTLTEEIALLRLDVETQQDATSQPAAPVHPQESATER
ncbi:DUF2304 domain-containing protein [Oerskovia sp. Root22]|jgi:hypothetical protein|uniref:DUF2304 domain-containing protein n=1 Tax=Oerskovia sp. Root22 TaxID=1736494 RepID=UPI0006F1F618|nr:DUF2304 domain-containing protein [Oerskovia sp. Root22]KRC34170.1 hypothetical protein ASE15_13385 [Oerskovia sp. Root22]